MILYLRLAWRNCLRHRNRTVLIVTAIGLTMAMMLMYDGLIGGFEQAIYGNAIKVLGGNIQIHAAGYQAEFGQYPLLPLGDDQAVLKAARELPQVVAATRRINTSGMVTSAEGAFGVAVVGIEPELEEPLSLLAQNIIAGRYLTSADGDVVFIGKGLAEALDVSVGDRITLVGRATHEQMRQRTMTVVGIYDLGMGEIEKRSVYISLAEAQELYGLTGQSTEVIVILQRIGQEAAVVTALQSSLPDYEIAAWETNFPELKAAITTKSGAMNIFGVIMLAIAGIGILNLLLMAIYERTREIGILGAMGMKPGQISWLFLLEGALLGLLGTVAGITLGLLLNFALGKIGFDYSQFASLTEYTALISGRVYSTMGTDKLAQRALTSLIVATLAALYPAREAAHNEPAEALHYV